MHSRKAIMITARTRMLFMDWEAIVTVMVAISNILAYLTYLIVGRGSEVATGSHIRDGLPSLAKLFVLTLTRILFGF